MVAQGFIHGISAKLVESAAGQCQRDHGLGADTRSRNHAYVGALISRLNRLARFEIDGLERSAQSRYVLQVASHTNVFSVRHAAFNTSGVVAGPGEARKSRRLGVPNLVMHS